MAEEKKLTVLREYHPRIIGKGGDTLKEIKQKTGATIEFPPRESTSEDIVIKGTYSRTF
jgi:predicted PilT family ATPase